MNVRKAGDMISSHKKYYSSLKPIRTIFTFHQKNLFVFTMFCFIVVVVIRFNVNVDRMKFFGFLFNVNAEEIFGVVPSSDLTKFQSIV